VSGSIDKLCFELRFLLEEATRKKIADDILLSGSLDTSVSAVIESKFISLKAFTFALHGARASDVEYASLVANNLQLKHRIYCFDEGQLLDGVQPVVEVMRPFDPKEIRNSVAMYLGLRVVRDEGINTIMTGDGCGEMFAGYSFLLDLEKGQLDLELQKLWSKISFSSVPLSRALGVEAKLPYLDPDFKPFAMKLDPTYKVRRERGKIWGKWIIRKTFEGVLHQVVVWGAKTPIEHGSGTTALPSIIEKRISNKEFEEKSSKHLAKDKVMIWNKEQLCYYEVYMSATGVPHPTNAEGKLCPHCSLNVAEKATNCRTCGAYPIQVGRSLCLA